MGGPDLKRVDTSVTDSGNTVEIPLRLGKPGETTRNQEKPCIICIICIRTCACNTWKSRSRRCFEMKLRTKRVKRDNLPELH